MIFTLGNPKNPISIPSTSNFCKASLKFIIELVYE